MIAYHNFSKPRKLAAFLILLGPEMAGEILKHFEEAELDKICREMASLPYIDESAQQEILDEFSEIVGEGSRTVLGGVPFLANTLGRAIGDARASSVLERVAPLKTANPKVVDEIREMEPDRVFNLLRLEQPQTIALILSQLEPNKAGAVLQQFSSGLCKQILERLARMEPTPLGVVEKVAGTVRRQLAERVSAPIRNAGGLGCVASFLNAMPRDVRTSAINAIAESDESLGEEIRKRMFSFDDLVRLAPADVQIVLRNVDMNDLALAMKSAGEAVRKCVFGAMSKRAGESLREEISFLRAAKPQEIKEARERVVETVRRLEEAGEISTERDDDE